MEPYCNTWKPKRSVGPKDADITLTWITRNRDNLKSNINALNTKGREPILDVGANHRLNLGRREHIHGGRYYDFGRFSASRTRQGQRRPVVLLLRATVWMLGAVVCMLGTMMVDVRRHIRKSIRYNIGYMVLSRRHNTSLCEITPERAARLPPSLRGTYRRVIQAKSAVFRTPTRPC